MRSFTLIAALSGLALVAAQRNTSYGVTGALGDAAVVEDNPVGVTYTATLPNRNNTAIRGYVSGTANENGTGVVFTVDVSGFTFDNTDEYIYHIHDQPVPPNGDCRGTLAHQDPYVRGEQPPCNASAPQTCQVGDLSGKHGNITSETYSVTYLDLYASTKEGLGSFFGNRSIVFHTANTTRLTCANFTLDGEDDDTETEDTTGTATITATGTYATRSASAVPSAFTGAAATTIVTGSTLFGALLAAIFAF